MMVCSIAAAIGAVPGVGTRVGARVVSVLPDEGDDEARSDQQCDAPVCVAIQAPLDRRKRNRSRSP